VIAAANSQPGVPASGSLLAFKFCSFGGAGLCWLVQLKPDPLDGAAEPEEKVTLSEFAALGEAVGGFAVLVTLVYLAYQFRQAATLERTAGQRDLLGQARH
jgi:hypothetical protein